MHLFDGIYYYEDILFKPYSRFLTLNRKSIQPQQYPYTLICLIVNSV